MSNAQELADASGMGGGMVMEVDVAIVGGGMAGLALAVALQERGIQAHVFEKAPAKRKHFGTGMSIGQNGMLTSLLRDKYLD